MFSIHPVIEFKRPPTYLKERGTGGAMDSESENNMTCFQYIQSLSLRDHPLIFKIEEAICIVSGRNFDGKSVPMTEA